MLSQICLPTHSFSLMEGPHDPLCLQPPPRPLVLPQRAALGPQVQFQLQPIMLPHPPMKEGYPHPLNAFSLFNGIKFAMKGSLCHRSDIVSPISVPLTLKPNPQQSTNMARNSQLTETINSGSASTAILVDSMILHYITVRVLLVSFII